MDFRLYCQNRESSSRIFSIPNYGMGGCDLIPPIQTRFSVRRMSTRGGTFVFLPLEVFCVFSLSAAGKARMGMPVDCLRDCHCKVIPDSGTFYGSPEFRRAYPHRTCLTPLLGKPERLSRKKNMSCPGASKILRKTSDSELGGIHFAHFPGDKGYLKILPIFPSLTAQPGNLSANGTSDNIFYIIML